jgi:hypothetical protein
MKYLTHITLSVLLLTGAVCSCQEGEGDDVLWGLMKVSMDTLYDHVDKGDRDTATFANVLYLLPPPVMMGVEASVPSDEEHYSSLDVSYMKSIGYTRHWKEGTKYDKAYLGAPGAGFAVAKYFGDTDRKAELSFSWSFGWGDRGQDIPPYNLTIGQAVRYYNGSKGAALIVGFTLVFGAGEDWDRPDERRGWGLSLAYIADNSEWFRYDDFESEARFGLSLTYVFGLGG